MRAVYLVDAVFVGIFGAVLSGAFCDIVWTRKKYRIMAGSLAAMMAAQGCICMSAGLSAIRNLYPVIVHVPLIGVLFILCRKSLWSVISVLTAYLCCQIRRWLALLITTLLSGDLTVQSVAELILTFPLLLFLIKYFAPSVRTVSHSTTATQCRFGLVPAIYYGFDYLTLVYTDLLTQGNLTVLEFMPFVCCLSYLIYILYASREERIRSQLERTQSSLNMQVAQSVREIESLRDIQKKMSIYRHDLRHHMQYLLACLRDEKYEQAQTYIREICSEIETGRAAVFCENETINLILSSFAGKAEGCGIPLRVKTVIPQTVSVSESDLCVLISNALENALHACQKVKEKGLDCMIDLSAYEKRGKIFLQITNSCDGDIVFLHGIPVTEVPGHGIGVRSICDIVEKYGGLYSFSVDHSEFILRISL